MISIYYRVKAGESLWQIAQRYSADPEEIVRYNRLEKEPALREGMLLRIPMKQPVRHMVETSPEDEKWITLQQGETLEEAAQRAGISKQMLLWLNGLSGSGGLQAGYRLQIRP